MPGRFDAQFERLFKAVEGYVARSLSTFSATLGELAAKVDALQAKQGPQGEPGKDGAPGRDGKDGVDGARGRDGVDGKDGAPGRDGKDGVDGAPGRDGVDGKDGAPGRDGIDGKDGGPGRNGVDGKDGEAGRDGKDGRDGRDGKDGAPGRDAYDVTVVSEPKADTSYPRCTLATIYGGLWYATRETDPVHAAADPATLASAGWRCVVRGIGREEETVEDDGRTVMRETVYSDGTSFRRTHKTGAMVHRGIWEPRVYERGDCVTRNGGNWHCVVPQTNAEPGKSKDWLLVTRKGVDGKEGAPGEPGKTPDLKSVVDAVIAELRRIGLWQR